MDLRHLVILIAGLASIAVAVRGPIRLVANPRNERDRAARSLLIGYAALSIGGGVLLIGYVLLT